MSAALECANLDVGYGSQPVLTGVNLALRAGEVTALLGPNGGGKTTLLRTLSGILPRLGGSITVGERNIDGLTVRELARAVAFVPQEEAWQFEFTVEEIVAMGRLSRSNGFFDTQEDRAAAATAMEEAGCIDLRSRLVTQLSGGERQRVLIARALAQESPIVFLDEPTAHLDPQYQQAIAAVIRGLAERGKALLLAIHDLVTAATVADRGLVVSGSHSSETRPINELLQSNRLESAYGASFDRIETAEGRLIVVPKP